MINISKLDIDYAAHTFLTVRELASMLKYTTEYVDDLLRKNNVTATAYKQQLRTFNAAAHKKYKYTKLYALSDVIFLLEKK